MLTVDDRSARILLVEDNPGDVELTRRAFRKIDVNNDIIVARDGDIALQRLRREGEFADCPLPDLILLDINLPKVNGKDVLNVIKNDPRTRMIPVIMLTTSTDADDVRASYSRHANAYLAKPVTLGAFIGVVSSIEEFWLSLTIMPKPEGESSR